VIPAARELEAIAGGEVRQDVFPLLSPSELADLPAPSFLLDPFVPRGGLSVLYGPSGIGKSFVALDWSLCVANGLPWYGRAVEGGRVVYIAAEGVAGLNQRVEAWSKARGHTPDDRLCFLPEVVNLLDRAQVEKAERTLAQLPEPPVLIVVDTMARMMVGGDENAARDVGLVIDAVDSLRRPFGSAALIVHHTGKNGEDERGSSALRGAADMMHSLKPDSSALKLECTKAKDIEVPESWTLHLSPTRDSCVLRLGSNPGQLGAQERQVLETLPAAFGTNAAPSGQLMRASGVPERSYYRCLQTLETRGLLRIDQQGRTKLYSLTEAGIEELLPTPADDCQADDPITAATATPLGVAGGSRDGR